MVKWLRYLFSLFIVVLGLFLVFRDDIKNYFVVSRQDSISISSVTYSDIKENNEEKGDYDYSQVRAINANDVIKAEINGVDLLPIGGIAIPDLKVNLPILKGTTNENLLYGAATLKEQEMGKGNYTLASHHVFEGSGSEDLLFSPIVNAREGMKIYLTDKSKIYTYEVESIDIVPPTAMYVLEDGETEEVTLITCTDAQASMRTVVKGTLKGISNWSSSDSKVFFEGEIGK